MQTNRERTTPKHGKRRSPERTCVGCGLRDVAGAMVRVVAADAEVAFDLAGGAFGRGAHVHPRAGCLGRAPRRLAHALRCDLPVNAATLGQRLLEACDRRMLGLLLAAQRLRAIGFGLDAIPFCVPGPSEGPDDEPAANGAPLVLVAIDAGTVASSVEVARAVAAGNGMAWGTKNKLGALLGREAVAVCTVRHPGIAAELRRLRAVADAANQAAREGAGCSRFPEVR